MHPVSLNKQKILPNNSCHVPVLFRRQTIIENSKLKRVVKKLLDEYVFLKSHSVCAQLFPAVDLFHIGPVSSNNVWLRDERISDTVCLKILFYGLDALICMRDKHLRQDMGIKIFQLAVLIELNKS